MSGPAHFGSVDERGLSRFDEPWRISHRYEVGDERCALCGTSVMEVVRYKLSCSEGQQIEVSRSGGVTPNGCRELGRLRRGEPPV